MREGDAPWRELAAAMRGRLILPGMAGFGTRRLAHIARFDPLRPRAIAEIADAADGAAALDFVRRHNLPFAIRCGGHSAAGYSSTTGLLVDLARLDTVEIDGDQVSVGAGVRSGPLAQRLAKRAMLVPLGTCPGVGVAGLALGGGFGHFGRAFGFTIDRLVALETLLADGTPVRCSETLLPDLFWALRGAGPGAFALVTGLAFKAVEVAQASHIELRWDIAAAASAILHWQDWIAEGPDGLSAELSVEMPGSAHPAVLVSGVHLGGEAAARQAASRLAARVGAPPERLDCRGMPLAELLAVAAGAGTTGAAPRQAYRVMKSQLLRAPLDSATVAGLVAHLVDGHRAAEHRSLELAPWGGAYNRRAPDATAFVHRDYLFAVQHSVIVDMKTRPAAKAAAAAWTSRSWALLEPHAGEGIYQNFPDPDLDDWERRYYGANAARLRAAKRRHDPGNLFRFGQSIRVEGP